MWSQAFLLLVCAGAAGAAALLALIAAAKGDKRRLRRAVLTTATIAIGYAVLVAAAAMLAPARVLARGEEKYICELDCHLAYSVVDVRRGGDSLIVRLNVRFDAQTIGSRRARDLPLSPGLRTVRLVGRGGVRYPPISLGDLQRTLRPGQSYQTELIFDVGAGASGLILYIADADRSKMVLVGSDNGPLRRPVGFQL